MRPIRRTLNDQGNRHEDLKQNAIFERREKELEKISLGERKPDRIIVGQIKERGEY